MLKPLLFLSTVYGLLFVGYIMLMAFVVLNIITGIFLERASEFARMDRDYVAQMEKERTEAQFDVLRTVFNERDVNGDGAISREEWEDYVSRPEVQAYFSYLSLDVAHATDIFKLLDVDDSNEVEIDEFVMGCMRLKGNAKGVQLESQVRQTYILITKLVTDHKKNIESLSEVEQALVDIQAIQRAMAEALVPKSVTSE